MTRIHGQVPRLVAVRRQAVAHLPLLGLIVHVLLHHLARVLVDPALLEDHLVIHPLEIGQMLIVLLLVLAPLNHLGLSSGVLLLHLAAVALGGSLLPILLAVRP